MATENTGSGLVTIKSVSVSDEPSAINREFIEAKGKKFEIDTRVSVPQAYSSFLSPVASSPSTAQKFASKHAGTSFYSTHTFFEGKAESVLPKYGSPGLEDYRDAKTIPFYPHWAFGMDANTKVANLSNNKNTIVYYTVSHMGVIYNSFTDTMKFLQGHHHYITCVSHDASGKWLVSADSAREDKDNAVIIWNTEEWQILCVGYSNGKIRVYNYNTCTLITTATIKSDVEKEYNGISCIRYSPHGYFLACGTTGGCIWFLETSIAQPQTETPFFYDKSEIELIRFSADNRYLAYSDTSVTVSLLKRYDKEDAIPEWLFHGRFCGHTKPITDLVFTSLGRLFSLSIDSHIIEYKVKGGELGKLDILGRQPIMQTAVPLCFLVYNIGPHCNDNYFIISTNQVKDFCLCKDGKYVFTLGERDNTCLMWRVWPRAIEIMEHRGGTELNPYYCLINGGLDGWLFHEMKDLFYYMQILYQGEDSPLPRETSRNIAISELPNIMRAIGFYPTEYELGLMLYEAKTFFCEKSETNPEEIKFENFVKLYINHRPALGITIDILRSAFDRIGSDGSDTIHRCKFIEVLCNQGEEFKISELEHCLKQLLHAKETEVDEKSAKCELLPPQISFDEFINDILGIEVPEP